MSLPIDLAFDPATVSLSPIYPGAFLYCSDGSFIESLNREIEGATNPGFCFVRSRPMAHRLVGWPVYGFLTAFGMWCVGISNE